MKRSHTTRIVASSLAISLAARSIAVFASAEPSYAIKITGPPRVVRAELYVSRLDTCRASPADRQAPARGPRHHDRESDALPTAGRRRAGSGRLDPGAAL